VVVPVMPVAPPVPTAMMVVMVMPAARAMLPVVRGGLTVGFGLCGRVRRGRLGRTGLGLLQHRRGLRCGCGGGDRASSGREAET
jgi:hypothetical protein